MPDLDVTDAFDEDTLDTLVCKRQAQTVGTNGRAVNTVTQIGFQGTVTNDTGDTLSRNPDGSRVAGGITVTTMFVLQMAGEGSDADIVTWDGRDYTVVAVKDYSRYGAGFVIASCALINPAG